MNCMCGLYWSILLRFFFQKDSYIWVIHIISKEKENHRFQSSDTGLSQLIS